MLPDQLRLLPERRAIPSLLRMRFGSDRRIHTTGAARSSAWTTTPDLPKAIAPEHAQCAIDSCDLGTAIGLRNRAVLLILARLGLRAREGLHNVTRSAQLV
jgi:hypothetical protein